MRANVVPQSILIGHLHLHLHTHTYWNYAHTYVPSFEKTYRNCQMTDRHSDSWERQDMYIGCEHVKMLINLK